MKYLYALAYLLALITQAPHVWSVYANLETGTTGLEQWTAAGVTVAFEASIGIFTYRRIKGSKRKWTARGIYFFLAASVLANATYYRVMPSITSIVMPVFAMLAIPLALALFAEEFGAEHKSEESKRKKAESDRKKAEKQSITADDAAQDAPGGDGRRYLCSDCGEWVTNMGSHVRWNCKARQVMGDG